MFDGGADWSVGYLVGNNVVDLFMRDLCTFFVVGGYGLGFSYEMTVQGKGGGGDS